MTTKRKLQERIKTINEMLLGTRKGTALYKGLEIWKDKYSAALTKEIKAKAKRDAKKNAVTV